MTANANDLPVVDEATCNMLADAFMKQDSDTVRILRAYPRALARIALYEKGDGLLDPYMPPQELRLHMGEMTAQEERTAMAAIRWANSRALAEIERLEELVSIIARLQARVKELEGALNAVKPIAGSLADFINNPANQIIEQPSKTEG